MSIVSVHGPNTFGSQAVAAGAENRATPDPANGLIWNFSVYPPSDRPAADFDWTFPGGTPATAADNKGPIAVTYASPGSKTATLTVSGASALEPPNGSYPITVTAVAGAAPRMVQQEAPAPPPPEAYDPGAHTVADVLAHADEHPDEVQALYDAEAAGKARVTLLDGLVERGAVAS